MTTTEEIKPYLSSFSLEVSGEGAYRVYDRKEHAAVDLFERLSSGHSPLNVSLKFSLR